MGVWACVLHRRDDQWIETNLLERPGPGGISVQRRLAQAIRKATRRFKEERSGYEREDDDAEAKAESKFFEDKHGEQMVYGDIGVFYRGLEGFLGPPNPSLDDTVRNEHTKQEDSKVRYHGLGHGHSESSYTRVTATLHAVLVACAAGALPGAQLQDHDHLAARVLVRQGANTREA